MMPGQGSPRIIGAFTKPGRSISRRRRPVVARMDPGTTFSLARSADVSRPYRGFLPGVGLDEFVLVTGFLSASSFIASGFLATGVLSTAFPPGAAFLATPLRDLAAPVFLAALVAPEVFGRVGADEDLGRLLTALRTPGPGMRLVSPPLSHRTVIMAPLTADTTPDRGSPLDATAIRSPTPAISVSSTERVAHRLMVRASNRSLAGAVASSRCRAPEIGIGSLIRSNVQRAAALSHHGRKGWEASKPQSPGFFRPVPPRVRSNGNTNTRSLVIG
jgi:hypothetical protein